MTKPQQESAGELSSRREGLAQTEKVNSSSNLGAEGGAGFGAPIASGSMNDLGFGGKGMDSLGAFESINREAAFSRNPAMDAFKGSLSQVNVIEAVATDTKVQPHYGHTVTDHGISGAVGSKPVGMGFSAGQGG